MLPMLVEKKGFPPFQGVNLSSKHNAKKRGRINYTASAAITLQMRFRSFFPTPSSRFDLLVFDDELRNIYLVRDIQHLRPEEPL
jgi:hypothetical protein